MNDLKPGVMKFFLDGYKPAIALQNSSQHDAIHFLRKSSYPYTKLIQGNTIFFQNEEKMKEFDNEVQDGRRKNKLFDHYPLLGRVLGIPPSATQSSQVPGRAANFVIDYFGLAFTTTVDLVNENLKWLKKTYPVPKNYPGMIEVIDKRETVYQIRTSDINNFKPLEHNGLFINKSCPIFSVTIMMQVIPTHLYNGYDVKKTLKVISTHKSENPQVHVWLADKLVKVYHKDNLSEFKSKYASAKNKEE